MPYPNTKNNAEPQHIRQVGCIRLAGPANLDLLACTTMCVRQNCSMLLRLIGALSMTAGQQIGRLTRLSAMS